MYSAYVIDLLLNLLKQLLGLLPMKIDSPLLIYSRILRFQPIPKEDLEIEVIYLAIFIDVRRFGGGCGVGVECRGRGDFIL